MSIRRRASSPEDDIIAERFSAALAETLHRLKLTHRDVAEKLGLRRFTVDSWTRAAAPRIPADENLVRLCALLDQSEAGAGRAVLAAARGSRANPAQNRPPSPVEAAQFQHNLPGASTSFVGRERDVAQIVGFFSPTRGRAARRLVTLTGAGGVGKTRLALQAAHILCGTHALVYFVELAAITDPEAVATAVASTLGLRRDASLESSWINVIVDGLRDRSVLLVLDNCEHLIDTCAALITQLLRSCPRLSVLTTSRELLRADGELVWRVPSLGLPASIEASDIGAIAASDAVRLFVDRAELAQPAFELDQSTAPYVAQICQRLDGIPFALELAAAAAGHLNVRQIAARLDDRFTLLTHGSRTALPRQHTLRATIAWSFDQLAPADLELLRRVAVFARGFTLAGAQAIGGVAPKDVEKMLMRLVDKSLLNVDSGAEGEPRYLLHETTREYALELMTVTRQDEEIRLKHLQYFAELASLIEARIIGAEQRDRIDQASRELDNIRAAANWAIDHPAHAETGLRMVTALGWYWLFDLRIREGIDWISRLFAAAPGADPRIRGRAMLFIGFQYWYAADAQCQAWLMQARDVCQAQSDIISHAYAEMLIAANEYFRGTLPVRETLAKLEDVGAIFSAQGDAWGQSLTLSRAGSIALAADDCAAALRYYEEAYEIRRRLGVLPQLAGSFCNMAMVELTMKDYARAEAHLLQALEYSRQYGTPEAHMTGQMNLAHVMLHTGRTDAAHALFVESFSSARHGSVRNNLLEVIAGLAYIAALREKYNLAARLCAAIQRWLKDYGITLWKVTEGDVATAMQILREHLPPQTLDIETRRGEMLTIDEMIALADTV